MYAASVPVFQTYNRMINLIGLHNPILDRLNFEKNRFDKELITVIHTILFKNDEPFFLDFLKKTSNEYKKLKATTELYSTTLLKLTKKIRTPIKTINDTYLLYILYNYDSFFLTFDLTKIFLWYEKMVNYKLPKLLENYVINSLKFISKNTQ